MAYLRRGTRRTFLTDSAAPQNRFLIRMGGLGWMVYDRERKGPAMVGTEFAANLTKEQAERAYEILTGAAREPEH